MICDSIKKYIRAIEKRMGEVYKLILAERVNKEDFLYEDYFGPEIIP